MACAGNYCASHCYSYGCTRNYRAPRPSYSYSFPAISDRPTAAFTTALRNAMNSELAARGSSVRVASGTVTTGTTKIAKFDNGTQILQNLSDCLEVLYGSSGSHNVSYTGNIVQWHFTDIRDRIQSIMRDCICNSDCGANAWCNCYNNCDCNYSDKNLKWNIKECNDDIKDKFLSIKSKKWIYKDDPLQKTHIGPIAQEVESVFPDAVLEDNNGYKMIRTSDLVGILWSIVQNQQKEIDELKEKVK